MSEPLTALPPPSMTPRRELEESPYSSESLAFDGEEPEGVWSGEGGPSFSEFLDIINPLQHLPVISTIYRAITGDEIGLAPRVLGAALFGGPLGILLAGLSAAFEEVTGGNIADHAVALFTDPTEPIDEGTNLAEALPDSAPSAPEVAGASAAPEGGTISNKHLPSGVHVAPIPSLLSPPDARAPLATMRFSGDAESRRITQSVLAAQKAQIGLLLASLGDGPKPQHSAQQNAVQKQSPHPQAAPGHHPNLAPGDVSPEWVMKAMNSALDKYQTSQALPATTDRGLTTTH